MASGRRRRLTDTKVLGVTAIVMVAVLPIVSLAIAAANAIADNKRAGSYEIPVSLQIAYGFAVAAITLAYIFQRLEGLEERQMTVFAAGAQGVEVFTNSKDFLLRAEELTVGATSVSTLNLSPSRWSSPDLGHYFTRVDAYLGRKHNVPLVSFRSIGSPNNLEKAKSLLVRAHSLRGAKRVSLAVLDSPSASLPLQLCIHTVEKDGLHYTFLFPPVDLTGSMKAVLIMGEAVASVMIAYFEQMWARAPLVLEAGDVRRAGLELLLRSTPALSTDPIALELDKEAT